MCSLYVPLSVGLVPALRQGVVRVFSVCTPVCWSCSGITSGVVHVFSVCAPAGITSGVVHVFSVCAPVCWSCAGIMWTPWCFVKIFHILLIVTFQFECPHSGYEYAKIDICYTL